MTRYQIIFHQGSYTKIDDEVDDYNQAQERRSELQAEMYIAGERNFYYEIREVHYGEPEPERLSDDYNQHVDVDDDILEDEDFNTLCGR